MGNKQIKNQALLDKIVLLIKQLRGEKGLTQEDFYNDTGIHIARIESGKANVSVSTLYQIVTYFEISLEEFFKRIKA
jgi:transcriptional regulator with XRE-family HTH domain